MTLRIIRKQHLQFWDRRFTQKFPRFITMFAASVGIRYSNEAEFMTIVYALEMSLQQEWIKQMEIIIETDSKNALTWVNKKEECLWICGFIVIKIKCITFCGY